MSVPKSQHVIPQCYLKQFVDPNTPADQVPYVWIFERHSKKGKKRAPKNILTETDIYTFRVKDAGKDYVLKRTLAQIPYRPQGAPGIIRPAVATTRRKSVLTSGGLVGRSRSGESRSYKAECVGAMVIFFSLCDIGR
jgi:hypothetical protein